MLLYMLTILSKDIDTPRFMLYYHCVRDKSGSLLFSTRVMNIAVLDVYGFQTCFGSAASAFENIELAYIHFAFKREFQRYFEVLHVFH